MLPHLIPHTPVKPADLMYCEACGLYGVPAPFNVDTCGNCNSHAVRVYHEYFPYPRALAYESPTTYPQRSE